MRKTTLVLGTAGAAGGSGYAAVSRAKRDSDFGGEQDAENQAHTNPAGESDSNVAQPASMSPIEDGEPAVPKEGEHEIDDQGTDQDTALQILLRIRDEAFDQSDEKLALALGRPTEEIHTWTSGAGSIDGDVLMKARALAIGRGLEF